MMKYAKYIICFFAAFVGLQASASGAIFPESPASVSVQASVSVTHGGVEVSNPGQSDAQVSVYAITGQPVKQCSVPGGATIHIELPSGCYIVRVDGLSRRVLIR